MSTRKIKDAVDHGTKELIYFKGHAKATYMSDGSTVEDTINNIESKIDLSDYVTTDELEGYAKIEAIPSLEGYVTETELNNKGFLTEHQDISHLASKDDVYDSISNIDFYSIKDNPVLNTEDGKLLFVDESGNIGLQLENDRLYVSDVVAGDHILSNKADIDDIPSLDGYAKTEDIPSLDGLVKEENLPNFDEFAKTEDIPSLDGLVKSEDLPNFDEFAKTEDIPSLDGYAKTEDIPSLDGYASKEWVNNKNYATEDDLNNIDYSSINNVPVSEDETGELNITDENGNIGMKIASEAVYAKDFVASEHKLSEKADKTYVDDSIAEIKNSSSDANVQAVDTGDVLDDVTVDYVTKTYVDGLVGNINSTLGNINSVLENIING